MSQKEEVQSIAYKLWEEEGRPQGREVQHWLAAEAIWQKQHHPESQRVQSDLPKPPPKTAKPRKRTTKKAT
jgi:hypothetical protein